MLSVISVAKTIAIPLQVACSRQQKNGKTSRRAHLTVLVHRELAIMLGRDIKLYTTVEPQAVDPSVAPPKIVAKYALFNPKERNHPRKSALGVALARPLGRAVRVPSVKPGQTPDYVFR